MLFFTKITLFIPIFTLFLGCESKKQYDISSDQVVSDLNTRIATMEEELKTLESELNEVRSVRDDKNISLELRTSIRKEIHEGDKHEKSLQQWIAYLKVQRKQRYASLVARKEQETLLDDAKREAAAYFLQKKLKPIQKPWLKRYRTAIEL